MSLTLSFVLSVTFFLEKLTRVALTFSELDLLDYLRQKKEEKEEKREKKRKKII